MSPVFWHVCWLLMNRLKWYCWKIRFCRDNQMLTLRAVIVCAEPLISRISPQKRIFQHNHYGLYSRGPGGLDSWKKRQKSCDTATLGSDRTKKLNNLVTLSSNVWWKASSSVPWGCACGRAPWRGTWRSSCPPGTWHTTTPASSTTLTQPIKTSYIKTWVMN